MNENNKQLKIMKYRLERQLTPLLPYTEFFLLASLSSAKKDREIFLIVERFDRERRIEADEE